MKLTPTKPQQELLSASSLARTGAELSGVKVPEFGLESEPAPQKFPVEENLYI